MAFVNAFQGGQQFALQQLGREQALQQAQAQEQRAERALTLREQQAAQRQASAARAEEQAIADRERSQQIEATRRVVGFFRQGIEGGATPDELIMRAAPALRQLGVTDEQFEPLAAEIAQNPAIINELEGALGGGAVQERRAVGRPVPVRLGTGETALLQTFSDGSSQIVEGATPLQQDIQQQRIELQRPEAQGRREEERAVGRARGERRAEDLPFGERATQRARRATEDRRQRFDLISRTIDQAIGEADSFTAGFLGNIASIVPGTPAADLANTLNTIRANVGFEELSRLRAASPTGGALGQVSERENLLLQSVLGSVEQSQSPAQLRTNLEALKEQLRLSQDRIAQAFEEDFGQPYGGPNTPIPAAQDGEPSLEELLNQFAPEG